jgi:redox-sensitive bicupin YhaK (pirin superfamily)
MITTRRADERGRTETDWLDSRHSFSFADYRDPEQMGFGPLRVINEDRVAPGEGFPPHGHRDMEIISYVLEGALAHKDSTGGGSVIRAGDVQRMSAGTGVRHSEFNASKSEPVHFLQIWIVPEKSNLAPGYEEKHFSEEQRRGRLRLVASRNGREDSLKIARDVELYASILARGETVSHSVRPSRKIWVQVARGAIDVNGADLGPGDGVAIEDEREVTVKASAPAEFLLFDMN